MATNRYFESSFNAKYSDQKLFNDLIIESIQIYGRDYYYLPRTLTNFDKFFGEDAQSAFNNATQVEMYLENTSGWEGDGSFISKFGLEIRDEATLVVAKTRWEATIQKEFGLKYPREGDIIVFPHEVDQRLRAFEITWVDDEAVFYQLGKLNTFRLKLRTFDYNGEEFNTGIEEIDSYNKYGYSQKLKLKNGSGIYQMGETVIQGIDFVSTVLGYDELTNEIILGSNTAENAVSYNPNKLKPLEGIISKASWYLDEELDDAEQMPLADNDSLEFELKDLISTKESNPFSGF